MKKILRFTASWCKPCQALSKNLEESKLEIPIEVIDIDVFDEIAIDYGVRSVPTLILFENDKEKSRLIGVYTPQKIRDWAND